MTFFDSKIFSKSVLKPGISSRSVGNRPSAQLQGSKFHGNQSDSGSQFFNRTGPIKLPHKQKFATQGGHMGANMANSQNQSQHVEDMFSAEDGMAGKDQRAKGKSTFSNTQPIKSTGIGGPDP